MVIDYHIPPQYVALGYEVLDEKGQVIRVVPRKMTESERLNYSKQVALAEIEMAEKKRLQEWDESLMLRYSAIEDIESARDRALGNLRIRVGGLKGNILGLKQRVESYQMKAADAERSGRQAEAGWLETIASLQIDITNTEAQIAEREREIAVQRAKYQLDIERFEQLLELVHLRRNMSAGGKK